MSYIAGHSQQVPFYCNLNYNFLRKLYNYSAHQKLISDKHSIIIIICHNHNNTTMHDHYKYKIIYFGDLANTDYEAMT